MGIILYEIARRNMVLFTAHFITHNTMTKEQFFKLQKKVLKDMKKESSLKD